METIIRRFSFSVSSLNRLERSIVGFSNEPIFQIRFSPSDTPIDLIVEIRDQLDCISEWNLSTIIVRSDDQMLDVLINSFRSDSMTNFFNHPWIRVMTDGNQNQINQIMSSLSSRLNEMNEATLAQAIAGKTNDNSEKFFFLIECLDGVPSEMISVSSLTDQRSSSTFVNASALEEFQNVLNQQANLRESLFQLITNLPITGPSILQLQAKAIVGMTESTNELTRQSLVRDA